MRLALVVFLATVLAGCAERPDSVTKCEALLLTKLKAPSSYKAGASVIMPAERGQQSIALTYDAVNSFNAQLRGTFHCNYDVATGLVSEENLPGTTSGAQGASLVSSAPDPAVPTSSPEPFVVDDETPVCDRPDSPQKTKMMKEIGVDCRGE